MPIPEMKCPDCGARWSAADFNGCPKCEGGVAMVTDMKLRLMSYRNGVHGVFFVAVADKLAALEAANADLKAQLSDIAEAHEQVMSEKCPADEVHCTCVSYLRQEIKNLRESIAALEDKCLDMEGQKVKVMEQLSDCQNMENRWHRAAKELMGTVTELNLQLDELREAAAKKAEEWEAEGAYLDNDWDPHQIGRSDKHIRSVQPPSVP